MDVSVQLVCLAMLSMIGSSTPTNIDDFESFIRNVSNTLDDLLSKGYDKKLRPDFGGSPTMIEVNMHIKSIGPVSENDQTYLMDVYFRQKWTDSRLRWEVPGLDEFSMSWVFLEKVWKPDTYFLNGKKSHMHKITAPNQFLRLRTDGAVTYSMRLTVEATCKMHLRKFPLDSQKCPLVIGSYGYTTEDLNYIWTSPGVTVEKGVEMAQYDLVNLNTKDSKFAKRGREEYSVAEAEFHLRRTIGYFVLQIYVPCSLIVCCSWVSFWITPSDVAGRVSLAVTTVLSITTLGFGGRSQLPQVSHATALDWWVIFCFAFVFAVIIEYAIINFRDKFKADLKKLMEIRIKTAAEKKVEKAKEKERLKEERERKKREAETNPVPTIHIEVTEYMDGEQPPPEPLLPPPETTEPEAPTEQKKTSLLLEADPGPSKRRWRSVPNILAQEHLGQSGDEWLKNMEAKKKETWQDMMKRVATAPVRYWRNLHFLPTEEEIRKETEEKRFTRLDIMARRVFPICFSCFVISYTLLYAYYIQDIKEVDE